MDIKITTDKEFYNYVNSNSETTKSYHCTLKNCNIENIVITKSLQNASFTHCTFTDVEFRDVMMCNACFVNCTFKKTKFSECNMTYANILSCRMEDVHFDYCLLSNIEFGTNAKCISYNLYNVSFNACYMYCAAFIGNGEYEKCNVLTCDLSTSSFSQECTWKNCSFSMSTLSRAYMDSTMIDCNLSYSALNDITSKASFKNCKFLGTNFTNADISHAKLDDCSSNFITAGLALVPPSHGEYIAWKVAVSANNKPYLVKLLIPADAKRSSGTTRKCRASKAKVLDFYTLGKRPTKIQSLHSLLMDKFTYERGKTLTIKDFDTNRWNECSTGIHHFVTIDDAIDWARNM